MDIKNCEETALQIAEKAGINIDGKHLSEEAVNFIAKRAGAALEDEKMDRDEFWKELSNMTEDELRVFVPDVYQKNIYRINYAKLKEKGIKLLSFDIDDTLGDCLWHHIMTDVPFMKMKMAKDVIHLFEDLKEQGFIVILLTNAGMGIAEGAYESLNADGYIPKANKPETESFERVLEKYQLDKTQMAHIGNSIRDDIVGGNRAGVTTCLVRRNGVAWKFAKAGGKLVGLPTKGHLIREKLKEKGMWHKHHARIKEDQYYQIGEVQKHSPNFKRYE